MRNILIFPNILRLNKSLPWWGLTIALIYFVLLYFQANISFSSAWYHGSREGLAGIHHETWLAIRNSLLPFLLVLGAVIGPLALIYSLTTIFTNIFIWLRRDRYASEWGRWWLNIVAFILVMGSVFLYYPWPSMVDGWWAQWKGYRVLSSMSDRDIAESKFYIHNGGVRSWGLYGFESNFVELTPREKSGVDTVWWYLRVDGNEPKETWKSLIDRYTQGTKLVAEQRWLQEWKSLSPDRTIELHFANNKGYAESGIDYFVAPAWQHAGFKGEAEFEIVLRRNGEACCTIYLSSQERNALVLSAVRGTARFTPFHWLDQKTVSFHPKQPTYITVTPNGQFEIKTIPQNDPKLRQLVKEHGVWFRLSD